MPAGLANWSTFQAFVASSMKPCHTNVVTSMEKSGLFGVLTRELSLLPFQAPAARAYWPAVRSAAVAARCSRRR